MNALLNALNSFSQSPIPVLDPAIPMDMYVPLDLSKHNDALTGLDITDPTVCQHYINTVLQSKQGTVAFGGYLEQRNLYSDKDSFSSVNAPKRNIHLGIDFWCAEGTSVHVPIHGTVHSFKNNNRIGDYGPTIILRHALNGTIFYSLYGHLSVDSLNGLFIGKAYDKGELLGRLGSTEVNVNYAPHLHFQLIRNLEGNFGDYPGVCAKERLNFYTKNCPDPNLLLSLG